jgi:hypothetical protein
MDDQENTVVTQLEFGEPKYQATIPERARRVLGVNDLEDDERAIVEAQLKLQEVYTKD